MGDETLVIDQMRRDLLRIIAVKYALSAATAWLFAWGIAVVATRVALGIETPLLWWGAAGLIPLVIGAVIFAIRRVPAPASLRAFIDHSNRAGGMVMAAPEADLTSWAPPPVTAPEIRLRGKSHWVMLAISTLFVAAGFLAPVRLIETFIPRKLDTTSQQAKIEKQIEVLEKAKLLDPIEAKTWREKLEQVATDAAGNSPAQTLESLDHLSQALTRKAEAGAAAELQKMEKLAAMQSAAEGLASPDIQLSPTDLTEAMKEVGRQVEKMDAERKLVEKLPEGLAEAVARGRLNKEQMKQVAKLLKENEAAVRQKLKEMQEAGLIDAAALKKANELEAQGDAAAKDLADFLKNEGDMPMEQRMEKWGNGGLDRGGDAAPLMLSHVANDKENEFKPEVLPPAKLDSLKESKLIGTSAAAPTETKEDGQSAGGALDGAVAGGGSASRHTLLPRHQEVVKKYFDHETKP